MSDTLSPKSAAAFTTGSNSVTFPFTSAKRALLFSNKSSLCFINTEVCFVKSSTAVLTLSIVESTFFIVLVTLTIKGKVNKTKIKKATAAIKPANAPYEIDIIYPPLIIPLIKKSSIIPPLKQWNSTQVFDILFLKKLDKEGMSWTGLLF